MSLSNYTNNELGSHSNIQPPQSVDLKKKGCNTSILLTEAGQESAFQSYNLASKIYVCTQ